MLKIIGLLKKKDMVSFFVVVAIILGAMFFIGTLSLVKEYVSEENSKAVIGAALVYLMNLK